MSQRHRRPIPQYDTPIVETHCHLDYLEDAGLQAVLEQAVEVGIERIVTISVSADNLDTVRSLADTHPQVWCTQGIHPHEADSWDASLSIRVRDGCTHERVIAVGEIRRHDEHTHVTSMVQIIRESLHRSTDTIYVLPDRGDDGDTRRRSLRVRCGFAARQFRARLLRQRDAVREQFGRQRRARFLGRRHGTLAESHARLLKLLHRSHVPLVVLHRHGHREDVVLGHV